MRLCTVPVVLSSLLFVACGGVVLERGPQEDSGVPGSGGNTFTGNGGAAGHAAGGAHVGAGGKVGVAGAPFGAGGFFTGSGGFFQGTGGFVTPSGGVPGAGGVFEPICCNAVPQCKAGDIQIMSLATCPPGAYCYETSACCTTIACRSTTSTCKAVPVCDPDDYQTSGPCPPNAICYTRSACGTTISCVVPTFYDGGVTEAGACTGTPPANVHYVSQNVSNCALLDYICPAPLKNYQDACGCGCQQDASCPEYVDCAPTSGPSVMQSPLCGDASLCPYTTRAL